MIDLSPSTALAICDQCRGRWLVADLAAAQRVLAAHEAAQHPSTYRARDSLRNSTRTRAFGSTPTPEVR